MKGNGRYGHDIGCVNVRFTNERDREINYGGDVEFDALADDVTP
jgi:hypothetical protein